MDIGLTLLSGDPTGFYQQDPETQEKLIAYWHLTHATEQIMRPGRREESIGPAALRLCLGKPASLSDLLEAWMLTHPSSKSKARRHDDSGARHRLKKDGASADAISFWLGDN